MFIAAYFLISWFGFINGIGLTSMLWLASMAFLDNRLVRLENKRYAQSVWGLERVR